MTLTNKQVVRIRKAYNTGRFTQTQLAERFGVTQQHVSRIVRHVQRTDAR